MNAINVCVCVFHPAFYSDSYTCSLYVFIRMDRHTNILAISLLHALCASKCARTHTRARFKIHLKREFHQFQIEHEAKFIVSDSKSMLRVKLYC